MGFSAQKYFPMVAQVVTLIAFIFAWAPFTAFFTIVFKKAFLAQIMAALVLLIPTLFLVGLNTNKKVFSLIMVAIGFLILIAILF